MSTDALSTDEILKKRIRPLAGGKSLANGQCVLYVMSRDQRVSYNYALVAAQKHALAKGLPLAVVFCLKPKSGHRSREHYQWMLQGLREVEQSLKMQNIPFLLLIGDPHERISGCIGHLRPDAVYFDFSPLRGLRSLQKKLATKHEFPMYVVDTHNIVPVWEASDKQEFSARTIRPKIHRQLVDFLYNPQEIQSHPHDWPGKVMTISELNGRISEILSNIPSSGQSQLQTYYMPGEKAAYSKLQDFITNRLKNYDLDRNNPTLDGLSGLSPYLHFGQISSLQVVLAVNEAAGIDNSLEKSADVFIEEMVVRKELSDNYCYYNQDYDRLGGAASWAISTLKKHATDPREFVYTLEEFEQAKTHDPAWNAAQLQMVKTGKMHGYMRMYWAKKVLEWSESPESAIKTLIYLNDFYSIDGGDPNGYVGIMWSVAGLHDRPWRERPVYGTVRSMVYTGLKRKFNIEKYIKESA